MSDEAVTRIDTPRRRARSEVRHDTVTAARLGHFQLLDELGTGGMGAVYAAYDLRLDRKVAIKVLHDDEAEPEQDHERNQRLLREAQAMAKLSHPNVVPIYEVGSEGDTVFIAMEYVEGKPLNEWLADKPSWRAIVDVFVQAARGLAAAHAAGIVHRDFKPANVLVDSHGRARVTDFGIALIQSSMQESGGPPADIPLVAGDLTPPSTNTPLTRKGALIGTPAYMSPEQFRREPVDARADQFSFCVTLYEALFGKRPFAGSRLDLAENVTSGRIEPPDPKSAVPSWVTAIVMRGLAPDPGARFPAMAALVDALSRDPSQRRKRIALGVIGGGAIAAVAALVAWGLSARGGECSGAEQQLAGVWDPTVKAAVARSFAATGVPYAATSAQRVTALLDDYRGNWITMRSEACRATRVRGEQSEHALDLRIACLDQRRRELEALTRTLSGAADARIVQKSFEAASALTPLTGCADLAALMQGEPRDPARRVRHVELESRLEQLIAQRRLGRHAEALAPTRALAADARKTGNPWLVARALELQGQLEVRGGELAVAETTLASALRAARQSGDPDLFVAIAIDYFDALATAGISKSREALGVARIAKAMLEDTRDPTLAVRLLVSQGDSMLTLARRQEALPLLEEAAALAKRTLGDDHALMMRVRAVLAPTLSFNEKHEQAKAVYDEQIAAATRMLGALHPTTITARLDLCRSLGASKGPAAAPPCYDAVLPDADRVIGATDRSLAIARSYYALALRSLKRYDDARRVLAVAYKNIPDEAWRDNWYVAVDVARVLGALELEAGDYRGALEHCTRARDTVEKEHRGFDVDTCIGDALLALGESARAVEVLEAMEPNAASAELALRGAWRFSYARAVWAGRHDAARARRLATQARDEVSETTRREIDAWLATLPR